MAVGDVEFEGRVNYTIIGRTVNVAQALEQCGRQVMIESKVVVPEATARSAGEGLAFQPCPEIRVSGATQIFHLGRRDQR